jgi:HlyD family secretion protein
MLEGEGHMSAEMDQPTTGRRRTPLVITGAVLVAIAVAVLAGVGLAPPSAADSQQAVFQVAKGPLTISVTESGTVQPRDQITIKSEVEGTSTILFLVAEGTHVKKGDLLVQLDSSGLDDERVNQEIAVQNADASYVTAREKLDVVRNQAQADNDQADLTLRFAKEDLSNYKDGEYPNQVKELEGKVTLADQQRQLAQDTYDWSTRLSEQKYISDSELKADALALKKSELDLDLANNNLNLLQNFTYKRTVDQYESNVSQAELALERTKLQSNANVVQAEAAMRAAESEFTRQKSKLAKIQTQIEKTKITAPADGLVVYATSAQMSRPGRDVQPLDEGQQVRERQELIYLPTGSTFKADVSIHESSLEKVSVGLPVRITVDALPGQTFNGTIASIAPLPDARSMFMNPDLKVYSTVINIDDGADVLRSGMTCKAEIIVAQYPSATYVPVQSIVRVKGKPTAFVKTAGAVEPRPVEIGLDNNRMVRVISGLEPGEEVLLNPPLAPAEAVEETHQPAQASTQAAASGGKGPAPAAPSAQAVPGGTPAPSVSGTPATPTSGTASASETPATPAASAQEAAPAGAAPSARGGRGMGGGRQGMTDQQREEMRKRFESMSPEEQQAMRQQWAQRRQGAGAEGAGQGQ